jgi:hypothetical protein
MDDLFREILASPSLCAAPLAGGSADTAATAAVSAARSPTGDAGAAALGLADAGLDAAREGARADDEEEMQALWDWLPAGSDAQGSMDVLSALELDVGACAGAWGDLLPSALVAPEVF